MFGKKLVKVMAISIIAVMAFASTTFAANTYEAVKGTPVLDGELDEAYKTSTKIDINVPHTGGDRDPSKAEATGTAYTLWDDNHLYVYVEVKDPHIYPWDDNGDNSHQVDSIDVFFASRANWSDPSIDVDWELKPDEGDQRVRAFGSRSAVMENTAGIKPENCIYKAIDGGYAYEIQIDAAAALKVGDNTGFDVIINDTLGVERTRIAIVGTQDGQDATWHKESTWNTLTLKDAPAAPADTAAPADDKAAADTAAPATDTAAPAANPATGDVSAIAYIALAGVSAITMFAKRSAK